MSRKSGVIFGVIAVIAVLVFGCTFFIVQCSNDAGKTSRQITREDTVESLNQYVSQVAPRKTENPIKGTVDLESTTLYDELPEIDKYPYKVKGNGAVDIEIFSSPEKAGSETSNDDASQNTWLINVVNDFNRQRFTTSDGKTVSVSLRSMSSGVMLDYISSGKYIPDGISPSNMNWISMLQAKGIETNEVASSLVGNVAGIVVSNETYDKLTQEYGSVNLQTVCEATIAGEIATGYTNPNASSAGLNYLCSALYAFDPSNPLSDTAVENFVAFQSNVPVVSYNTVQMQGAVDSGVLDVMVSEYQAFVNTPELSNFKFIPFGIRHDNPLYTVGSLSADKQEAFKIFGDYATSEEVRSSADSYGFNGYSDYVPEVPEFDGNTLVSAQKIWKDKKDNGQEIISVFIVDTSGSVDGVPLNQMKQSLINGAQYINPDNYVGLVSYNSDVTINLPIAQFDLNQRAYFNGEIEHFTAGGGTRTFDAIAVGLQMLEEAKADHPNAKTMLFVLSDGVSDGSLNSVRDFIQNLSVPVYTIGYNADIEALKEISSINEAASVNADTDDIIYTLKNPFNAQM